MAEVPKTMAELIASFPSNLARDITAALLRDFVASIIPARGRFSLTATAPTSFPDSINYVKGAIGTGVASGHERFFTYADGRLTYTGDVDIHVHVAVTLSMDSESNNQIVNLRIAKNGDPNDPDAVASETDHKVLTGGDVDSTAVHYDGHLSKDDYLEAWMRNQTSLAEVTLRHVYFFILGMMDVG